MQPKDLLYQQQYVYPQPGQTNLAIQQPVAIQQSLGKYPQLVTWYRYLKFVLIYSFHFLIAKAQIVRTVELE